jgi:histone-lysine N-methyltransferase SETMAR
MADLDLRLEQRYVIKFLYDEGNRPSKIERILKDHYKRDAPSLSTVQYWVRHVKCGRTDLNNIESPGRTPDEGLAHAILRKHEEDPRCSVTDIGHALNIAPATAWHYLRDVLKMKLRNVKWIPHVLTEDQKAKRTEFAQSMLATLAEHRDTSFRYLLTGDETWMFYAYYKKRYWMSPWEDVEEVQRPSHHQKKRMLSVFFNGQGDFFCNFLPEGETMNSTYYVEQILAPLSEFDLSQRSGEREQVLTLHFDNAPIHNSAEVEGYLEDRGLSRMPHPAYSPDLAPCDFYLFGYLKGALAGQSFQTLEDLSDAVHEVLSTISPETLVSVFENWVTRLEACCRNGGEYYK